MVGESGKGQHAHEGQALGQFNTHWLGAGMLAAAEEAPPRSSAMRWRALAPALGLCVVCGGVMEEVHP